MLRPITMKKTIIDIVGLGRRSWMLQAFMTKLQNRCDNKLSLVCSLIVKTIILNAYMFDKKFTLRPKISNVSNLSERPLVSSEI